MNNDRAWFYDQAIAEAIVQLLEAAPSEKEDIFAGMVGAITRVALEMRGTDVTAPTAIDAVSASMHLLAQQVCPADYGFKNVN